MPTPRASCAPAKPAACRARKSGGGPPRPPPRRGRAPPPPPSAGNWACPRRSPPAPPPRGGGPPPRPRLLGEIGAVLGLPPVAPAGAGGGFVTSVAGGGALIPFPPRVPRALPPLSANVTLTVGIVPASAGGALG